MDHELVKVASYRETLQAEAARNFLEGEGITAFVENEQGSEVWGGVLGSCKVMVGPTDALRAKQLLTEVEGDAEKELESLPDELLGEPEE